MSATPDGPCALRPCLTASHIEQKPEAGIYLSRMASVRPAKSIHQRILTGAKSNGKPTSPALARAQPRFEFAPSAILARPLAFSRCAAAPVGCRRRSARLDRGSCRDSSSGPPAPSRSSAWCRPADATPSLPFALRRSGITASQPVSPTAIRSATAALESKVPGEEGLTS